MDLEKLRRRNRDRPLVVFVTRYLPHFRREIFGRLSTEMPDVDLLFLHTLEIPRGETGIETQAIENGHAVKMYYWGNFCLQPESVRQVFRLNPDVIVCEASTVAITFYLCGFLQRLRGKGVVYWTKGPSPMSRKSLRKQIGTWVFRIYSMAANVLIGYGKTSRDWFRAQGWPEDRIVVAQNSIDTSVILNQPEHWVTEGAKLREDLGINNRFVIGTVSRLVTKKRVDLILEATERLNEQGHKVTALIGGDGPVVDELKAQAAGLKHADVRFLGKLPHGHDNAVLAATDVSVFPGGVGLAMIQSMALAKPTIIADEPFADTELLIHNQNGLRFECGNADALTKNLQHLIEDPSDRARLGAAAKSHIENNATIENMVSRIAEAARLARELTTGGKK